MENDQSALAQAEVLSPRSRDLLDDLDQSQSSHGPPSPRRPNPVPASDDPIRESWEKAKAQYSHARIFGHPRAGSPSRIPKRKRKSATSKSLDLSDLKALPSVAAETIPVPTATNPQPIPEDQNAGTLDLSDYKALPSVAAQTTPASATTNPSPTPAHDNEDQDAGPSKYSEPVPHNSPSVRDNTPSLSSPRPLATANISDESSNLVGPTHQTGYDDWTKESRGNIIHMKKRDNATAIYNANGAFALPDPHRGGVGVVWRQPFARGNDLKQIDTGIKGLYQQKVAYVKEMFSICHGELIGIDLCLEQLEKLVETYRRSDDQTFRGMIFTDSQESLDRLEEGINSIKSKKESSAFYYAHTLPVVRSCVSRSHKLRKASCEVEIHWLPRKSTPGATLADRLAGRWKNQPKNYWSHGYQIDQRVMGEFRLRWETNIVLKAFFPSGFPWLQAAAQFTRPDEVQRRQTKKLRRRQRRNEQEQRHGQVHGNGLVHWHEQVSWQEQAYGQEQVYGQVYGQEQGPRYSRRPSYYPLRDLRLFPDGRQQTLLVVLSRPALVQIQRQGGWGYGRVCGGGNGQYKILIFTDSENSQDRLLEGTDIYAVGKQKQQQYYLFRTLPVVKAIIWQSYGLSDVTSIVTRPQNDNLLDSPPADFVVMVDNHPGHYLS
ncbi:hypothetical protein V8F06_012569 [Rhypophila decipiens]